MPNRLRAFLASKLLIFAVALVALYLLGGFLALPAIVKWQVEKQVPAQLGHPISVGAVRFNPLLFRFEVDDLTLSDPQGEPMFGFRHLLVDFELRSVVDRAWTFAEARVEAPVLHLRLDKGGRHNFAALLERLPESDPKQEDAALPRFIVSRISLSDARIDYSDESLEEALVTHIEPLQFEVDGLSSLPEQAASFRLSTRTAAGEELETSGELALNPIASKGRLTLRGLQVKTLARSLSRRLAIDSPAGVVDFAASFELAVDRAGTLSGSVYDVAFDVASLSVSASGAASPLLAIESLSLQGGRVELGAREAEFAAFRLVKGRLAAALDKDGRINWQALLRESEASAPAGGGETAAVATPTTAPGAATPDSATATGGEPQAPAPGPWRVAVASAKVSQLELAFSDAAQGVDVKVDALGLELAPTAELGSAGARVALAEPKLSIDGLRVKTAGDRLLVPHTLIEGGQLAIVVADERLELTIDKANGRFEGIEAQRGADGVKVHGATVAGEQLSLQQAAGVLRIAGRGARASAAGLAARQGSDRVAVQDASLAVAAVALSVGGPSSATSASGLELRFDDTALRVKALGVVAQGAESEVGRVAAATVGAGSLRLSLADGPVDLTGDGLSAELSDTILNSPADASEMLRAGRLTLAGGALRLRDRAFSVATIALARGAAHTWLDQQGRFNGLILTRSAAAAAVAAAPDAAPATSDASGTRAADPAWRVAVESTEVDDFALTFEDRRGLPRLAVGLEAIRARIKAFETGVTSPMQVEFEARLASGGEIATSGSVRADNGTSDLQLKLTGIALAPVQPYLSEFAELRLASGTVSSAGRLRYGDAAGATAQLAYEGSFALDRLQLDEVEPARPFLAWQALATDDLRLTVEPNRLDIGELRLVRPSGRLIIAADQSVNLTDVLRKPEGGEVTEPASGQPAADEAAPPSDSAADPFPVTIARLRVSDGELEFADLSLRPQFGTRMHELNGVITGLGTDPNGSAKVQLDARVDKYGSAKIRGQLSVFRPAKLTDVEMSFRNVAMNSLSPYTVKFAGYRITAGRLTLDLQYKVKDGKLRGENKIVLKKMKLGEKVDSPDAGDLPLDLAIAILTDSEGVIDIGLPVSGDLNDPQFDYGAVIGKAFGNLLGSIVTAPFRALGALFGGGEKAIDTIDFEPGSAVVAPPERQKLAAVARAMNERQALRLIVPPTYAAAEDRSVLKSRAVRSEIVKQMGIELAAGEDPGPIDTANPRAQSAVEAAFSARYAPAVFAALKRRALDAAPASPAVAAPTAGDGKAAPAAPPPGPPPAFYQTLLDRLISEQPIEDETLAQLASRRGEAIVAELTTVGGVAAARVALGEARQATAANDQAVTLQLQLEVAK
ncbi:DUF748 domain-containing protein [Accumulibacter sp.]|uniref:DUF748 domain-containing protein n=1 Tax=Accumulibacter sp. TaxID=2053492 RepID=UPI002631E5CF|nr:DUF748 domain-containing protein [Accumulibacter sp.]